MKYILLFSCKVDHYLIFPDLLRKCVTLEYQALVSLCVRLAISKSLCVCC